MFGVALVSSCAAFRSARMATSTSRCSTSSTSTPCWSASSASWCCAARSQLPRLPDGRRARRPRASLGASAGVQPEAALFGALVSRRTRCARRCSRTSSTIPGGWRSRRSPSRRWRRSSSSAPGAVGRAFAVSSLFVVGLLTTVAAACTRTSCPRAKAPPIADGREHDPATHAANRADLVAARAGACRVYFALAYGMAQPHGQAGPASRWCGRDVTPAVRAGSAIPW